MTIPVTDRLVPAGSFAVVDVANVSGAQSATDVSTAISGAIDAIPSATTETDGLMTSEQVAALGAAQTAQQVADAVASGVSTAAGDATSKANVVRLGAPRVYATKAELRAATTEYALNTRVMFEGDPDDYLWSSGSTLTDDGTDGSNAVQVGALAGRFVRAGYSEGPRIGPNSGTGTLWSRAIAEGTIVEVEIRIQATNGTEDWLGYVTCLVKRATGGSVSILSQTHSSPWRLDDPTWAPVFDISSNALRLRVVSDATGTIVSRLQEKVRVQTIIDATVTDAEARAAVIADGYAGVYFADAGLTPASPNVGDDVTAWADQSGSGRNMSLQAGYRPKYRLDGDGDPYLEMQSTTGVYGVPSGSAPCTGARVYRWVTDPTTEASGNFSILFGRNNDCVAIHASGFGSGGSGVVVSTGGAWTVIGNMQSGRHCYEIRIFDVEGGDAAVTLHVDGMLVGTQTLAYTATSSVVCIGLSTSYPAKGAGVHAMAFKDYNAATVDAEMARWNAFSLVAWGANG